MGVSGGDALVWIGALVAVGLGAVAAAHAVMYKRDPRGATLWALASLLLPILGPWLYWALGINRIERRAARLGRRERPFEPAEDHEPPADDLAAAVGHLTNLRRTAYRVTRLPALGGNRVVPLRNGDEAFPRMLEAIDGAERSVCLMSYLLRWDEIGHRFADALGRAAERGVRVHALFDGIGALGAFSRMGRRLLRSGAEVASFFPLRFPFGRVRLNLRNHRKILVIDGTTGFTGGINISEEHVVRGGGKNRIEDLHFEVRGPVVYEMQHAFVEDWALATGAVLEGESYYPSLSPSGPAVCRAISSGPDQDLEKIHWIVQAAFTSARQRAWVATPYLVPTAPLISAMAMAALRGVDIRVLLPAEPDHRYMRWVADAYLWQLLTHGIRVFRRGGRFVHTKLLVIDDLWSLVGSANLDPRSFRLNFEFNLEAYDPELARSLVEPLERAAAEAEEVTLADVDARPAWKRLRDGTVRLASPFL